GDDDVALSVLTVMELSHGVARANTSQRRERRQRFLSELLAVVPIQPVTSQIALLAGRIDGERQANGVRIPLSDLLIGATALNLGYAVGTANLRQFRLLPDLRIVEL